METGERRIDMQGVGAITDRLAVFRQHPACAASARRPGWRLSPGIAVRTQRRVNTCSQTQRPFVR